MCIDTSALTPVLNVYCLSGTPTDAFKKGQAGTAHHEQLAHAHRQAHHECSAAVELGRGGRGGGLTVGDWAGALQGYELRRRSALTPAG